MSEAFIGRWKLDSSDNFDEYMKAVGVGLLLRKTAGALKPDTVISKEGEGDELKWKIRTESTFKTTEIDFKIGEEFAETTGDGRDVKTTVTLEGDNTLVQSQKGDPDSVLKRVVDGDTLTLTLEAKGVVCTRVYKKQA